MIPEPLANVRSYLSEEDAYADLAVLDAQGVIAYVLVSKGKGGDGSIRLRVPKSNAARALELLGPEPPGFRQSSWDDPDGDFACPRCRSTRSKALPPYHLMSMVLAVGLSTWLATIAEWKWVLGVAVVGSLVLNRIEWNAPNWRCINCSHTWNHSAERRRREDARRAAPD